MNNLVIAPLLIHITGAIASIFLLNHYRASRINSLLTSGLSLISAVWLLATTQQQGIQVLNMGNWPVPFGISLVSDLLAAFMVVLGCIVAAAVSLYAWRSIEAEHSKFGFFFFYHLMVAAVLGAFLTGDLFNLFVWFEVMLMASFALMVLGEDKQRLSGGLKYVVLNLMSSVLFLVGIAFIYGRLGTLNMADIAHKISISQAESALLTPSVLLIVAFAVKAGLYPFFSWLPASYHTLRPVVVAAFAGLLTKVGVYALIRVYTLFFSEFGPLLFNLLLVISLLSMVIGVLGAASKFSIKQILSFHIISQIGYKTLGLALFTPLGLAASLFYMAHNMITKTNLFLIGGIVERHLGTDQLKQLGDLFSNKLLLSVLFLVSALSLGGIPPLSGFFAKFLIVKANFETGQWLGGAAAVAVGMLSLFSMIKIWGEAFLKKRDNGESSETEVSASGTAVAAQPLSKSMMLSAGLMSALIIAMGLGAASLLSFTLQISEQLLSPGLYIQSVMGG